jgi:hypothetical protein
VGFTYAAGAGRPVDEVRVEFQGVSAELRERTSRLSALAVGTALEQEFRALARNGTRSRWPRRPAG